MSTPRPWSTNISAGPVHSSGPTLSLTASAPIPTSSTATPASSATPLYLVVHAGGSQIAAEDLVSCALLTHVRKWIKKHKESLAVSSVSDVEINEEGGEVSVRLGNVPTLLPTLQPTTDLESLTLSLKFSSSSHEDQLEALLLDTTDLHFTLAPLLDSVLPRFAAKVAQAFPLCFNAKWIQRQSNDLASHSHLTTTLFKILESDPQSTDLKDQLTKHLNLTSASPNDAWLLCARNTLKPDKWDSKSSSSSRKTKQQQTAGDEADDETLAPSDDNDEIASQSVEQAMDFESLLEEEE